MEDQIVDEQTIVQGPMASQVAIKMLGTNGGGYINANAAHPFENPTPLSNFIQMLSIFCIGSGADLLPRAHGEEPGARLGGVGGDDGAVPGRRLALLVGGGARQSDSSAARRRRRRRQHGRQGSPLRHLQLRLFATVTTDASCGAVNSMHDSFTPLGGFVPLFNIQLGEIIFGGVGAGLYGMLVFVVLAVFIAGLMVGRTPEYLGKKIESYEVKMAMLALLVLAVSILGFAAWASVSKWGTGRPEQHGPHGLSEILYAYSSGQRQQRQRLRRPHRQHALVQHHAGPGDAHRPVPDDRADHGAGRLARRRRRSSPASAGTFPVSGGTFVVLLLGTVLLVGALNFLPGADARARSSSTS